MVSLGGTHKFDWGVVLRRGSKNQHHKVNTCLKDIRLCLQVLLTTCPHSIANAIGST